MMTETTNPCPVVRVATRQLRPGMVLAESVPAPGGDGVLLEQGAALHERAIALLTRREIAFVYVRNSAAVRAQVASAAAAEEVSMREVLAADDTPEQSGSDNLLVAAREAVAAMVVTSAGDRETAAAAWQGAHNYIAEAQAGMEIRRRVDGAAALQQVEALLAALKRDEHSLVTLVHQRARRPGFDLAAHAVNVTVLTLMIGLTLRLPDEELRQAGQAALLHDLGMMRLDEPVTVNPSGQLDLAARMNLKAHPAWSAEALGTARKVEPAVVLAVHEHHEREDGSGYPRALDSKVLSRLGRILAVADTYERLVSPRPYREANLPYAALKVVLGKAGRRLEREAVRALLDNLALYPVGSVVKLNTREIAVVVGANPSVPLRPIIRLLRAADGGALGATSDLLKDKTRFIVEALSQVDGGGDAE